MHALSTLVCLSLFFTSNRLSMAARRVFNSIFTKSAPICAFKTIASILAATIAGSFTSWPLFNTSSITCTTSASSFRLSVAIRMPLRFFMRARILACRSAICCRSRVSLTPALSVKASTRWSNVRRSIEVLLGSVVTLV